MPAAPFEGVQPERWLVRVLVTRDPEHEGLPCEWNWPELLQGGDPILIGATRVGFDATEGGELCPVIDLPSSSQVSS